MSPGHQATAVTSLLWRLSATGARWGKSTCQRGTPSRGRIHGHALRSRDACRQRFGKEADSKVIGVEDPFVAEDDRWIDR
jgi:hypothetical protein